MDRVDDYCRNAEDEWRQDPNNVAAANGILRKRVKGGRPPTWRHVVRMADKYNPARRWNWVVPHGRLDRSICFASQCRQYHPWACRGSFLHGLEAASLLNQFRDEGVGGVLRHRRSASSGGWEQRTLFAKNTSRVSELTESLCSAGKKLGVKLAKDVILICRRVELLHSAATRKLGCHRPSARVSVVRVPNLLKPPRMS